MKTIILKIISRYYDENVESMATRILYFFNTIDTYFLIAGISSFLIVFHKGSINVFPLLLAILFAYTTAKVADFYPSFILFGLPVLIMYGIATGSVAGVLALLLIANIVFFFLIQFLFMGIPDAIVARDVRVPFLKMYNSLFTVAPTTVSFSVSVYFSCYLSFCMMAASTNPQPGSLILPGTILIGCAFIARLTHPKNRFSKFHKPDVRNIPVFKRVVLLNIDGVRKDVFDSLNLPVMVRLIKEGTSHPQGLVTVFRALTNPAFASIFTGTTPPVHGVRDNNLGQFIKTEGLPDIVPTIAYGSMHVKHFCKKTWETKIVSLPRHSIYHSDNIMVEWLKDDLMSRDEVRLFIADFSEADFLAHAYGSTSEQYREALRRIDARIGDLLEWMRKKDLLDGTGVIVCSDHGIAAIDHSYLIADSEKYVPFIMYGQGIRKGCTIQRPGTIMDICCTVAYLLGIPYPKDSRGQVFTEAVEGSDFDSERELLVYRFNSLKYDAEANRYRSDHSEVYEGDAPWWDRCGKRYATDGTRNRRILDIGCGNGFVGERFLVAGAHISEFVCMDVSENIIKGAKKSLGGNKHFAFTTSFDGVHGKFDVITANSVMHHVVHPEKMAQQIDDLLTPGGIVIGSHEPNRNPFRNRLFYAAAALYKRLGGGITIDDSTVNEFNRLMRESYPGAPSVCREEILQMVEYHSPLEQYDRGIDIESGFVPDEMLKLCFPGYKILEFETYSTYYHRPWLSRHRLLQSLMAGTYKVFFREGNLFRFVLQKA